MAAPEKKRAVIVGSGPNGLAAAITMARAGYAVTVHEAADTIGGGARSAQLTLPGFVHDVCSAIHPLAVASPCFEAWPLAQHGLEWVYSEAPLAHPLDDGTAIVLKRSVAGTAAGLGRDGAAWTALFTPLVEAWPGMRRHLLGPLSPRMARFGIAVLRGARFRDVRARALFAGLAAHSTLPLDSVVSTAAALVLGICAHASGWPFPRGGAQRIADALAGYLRSLTGEIVTGSRIAALPQADVALFDVGPRQFAAIAGDRLPADYRAKMDRYRYGPGAFKVDWALDAPIPWRARECTRAATVHLGGTSEEIARWEAGHRTGPPFVLLAQHTLFDPTRAPAGNHTAWAYCHVPNGSTLDMTQAIENQVERFAPGFRSHILTRSVMPPAALEAHNPNLVGGDFSGGAVDLQQFVLRPTASLYRTPLAGVYLCSASTPPGGGVHGMCGWNAANLALKTRT